MERSEGGFSIKSFRNGSLYCFLISCVNQDPMCRAAAVTGQNGAPGVARDRSDLSCPDKSRPVQLRHNFKRSTCGTVMLPRLATSALKQLGASS